MSKPRKILESFPGTGFPQFAAGTVNVDGDIDSFGLSLRNRLIFGQDPNPRSISLSDTDITRDFLIQPYHVPSSNLNQGPPGPFDHSEQHNGLLNSTWTQFTDTTYTVESSEAPNILSPGSSLFQLVHLIRMKNIDKEIQSSKIVMSGVSASVTLATPVNPARSLISHQGTDCPGSTGSTASWWVRLFFSDNGATLNVARGAAGPTLDVYYQVIEFSSVYAINIQEVDITLSGTKSVEIDPVDLATTFVWKVGSGYSQSGTTQVKNLGWWVELFDETTVKAHTSGSSTIRGNLQVVEFR